MTDAPQVPAEIVLLVEKLHRAAIGLGPSTRAPAVAALLTATIATALREAREEVWNSAVAAVLAEPEPEGPVPPDIQGLFDQLGLRESILCAIRTTKKRIAARLAALGRGTEEGP